MDSPRFLVDHNIGKLARWLRLLGFDAAFFTGADDNDMVKQALAESRIILTRDTAIQRRRVATSGRFIVITFETENADEKMWQLLDKMPLIEQSQPYTRCIECNAPLRAIEKPTVTTRIPQYTFETQEEFMECPVCGRVYWRGTHWHALEKRLAEFGKH
jgi:uncharacterized protein with PIN domain